MLVWCKACHHQVPADLEAIIDAGQGDRPLKDLKLRCAKCGSRLTDAVVMGKGAIGVQPWRHEVMRHASSAIETDAADAAALLASARVSVGWWRLGSVRARPKISRPLDQRACG